MPGPDRGPRTRRHRRPQRHRPIHARHANLSRQQLFMRPTDKERLRRAAHFGRLMKPESVRSTQGSSPNGVALRHANGLPEGTKRIGRPLTILDCIVYICTICVRTGQFGRTNPNQSSVFLNRSAVPESLDLSPSFRSVVRSPSDRQEVPNSRLRSNR
jgi:hypothetical protein